MWKLMSNNSLESNFGALFMELGLLGQRITLKIPIENKKFPTVNYSTYKIASDYGYEVARVLSELELTVLLAKQAQPVKSENGDIWITEEIIYYYNGLFLDLLHQMKDKLFIFLETIFNLNSASYSVPITKKMKVKRFIERNNILLNEIGIMNDLTVWSDDIIQNSSINVCIRKRTQYHHRLSNLISKKAGVLIMIKNTKNVHDTQMTEEFEKNLHSFSNSLKEDVDIKIEDTIIVVTECIESISSKISKYYSFNDFEKALEIYNVETKKLPPRTGGVSPGHFAIYSGKQLIPGNHKPKVTIHGINNDF